MKTPEEIKRGLEHCAEIGCKDCPYEEDCKMFDGFSIPAEDAYFYIQKLEREKEVMLRDMKAWPACDACKHRNLLCTQKPCSECREAGNGKTVMWEWRGVEEDEHV